MLEWNRDAVLLDSLVTTCGNHNKPCKVYGVVCDELNVSS